MPPHNEEKEKDEIEDKIHRSVIYIGTMPVQVDQKIDTMDGEVTNEEEEAKGESGIEDRIYAELLSPPQGSEVYIDGIPADSTKEELEEFCKAAGEVVKVKIVRKYNGRKVYAFVSFRTMEMASEAIKKLQNCEFKGKKVNCSMSRSMSESQKHAHLLSIPPSGSEVYISGIHTDAIEEEIKEFCKDSGEVVEVEMRNEGRAFVSFRTVDMASRATKVLHNAEFKGEKVICSRPYPKNTIYIGNIPRNWEECELKNAITQVGHGAIRILLMKGTAVYVQNLPKGVTEEKIKELFERHGDIKKVVLPPPRAGYEKRIAFVHFNDCSKVIKALQNNERYELNGQVLGCSLVDYNSRSIVDSPQPGHQAQTNQRRTQMLDDPDAFNIPNNPDDE